MKYFVVVIWCFIYHTSVAQTNFLAYQVAGTVSLIENNQTTRIKIGKILTPDAILEVSKDSRIMLVCENSSGIVTLKQGKHRLNDYVKNCVESGTALLSNYLKYVWWELTHPPPSPEEKRKVAWVGGGVSRGCPGIGLSILFDTLRYYKEEVSISFQFSDPQAKKEFVVFEYENSVTPLATFLLESQSFNLKKLIPRLPGAGIYFWTIRVNDQEICQRNVLEFWDADLYNHFIDSLNLITRLEVSEAERNYMLGFFLEQHYYYGEAYRYYRKALNLIPGEARYKQAVDGLGQLIGMNKR